MFNRKHKTDLPSIRFVRMYQHADGTYLPDSSQPDPENNFEITTGAYTPHQSTRYLNITIGSNRLPQRKDKSGNLMDAEKALPELYESRENCCGCTACYAICPVQAITMRPCEEGFLYPVVDAGTCICCYRCLSVCALKRE